VADQVPSDGQLRQLAHLQQGLLDPVLSEIDLPGPGRRADMFGTEHL
jgi:hypothetical protein